MEESKMGRKGSFAQVGWMDRWTKGWPVENLPFVLPSSPPPPPNDVAADGSTCLLLAHAGARGGGVSNTDPIPS